MYVLSTIQILSGGVVSQISTLGEPCLVAVNLLVGRTVAPGTALAEHV